jgi:AAA+ ATPase superfamily predicted ATPase
MSGKDGISALHLKRTLEIGSQLVLMYGRRRVGKTHLLGRAWKEPRSFYFTASETTAEQNRKTLLATFAEWSGEPIHAEVYPT